MPNWKKVITSGSLADLSSLKLSSVVNADTDTDKFLVLDSSNNVDFRTGAQVRSDIGAGTGNGTVDTSGTPADNDFAKFTDANTVEGRSYSEVKSDLGLTTTSTVQFEQLGIGVSQTGTSGRLKVNEHAIVGGNVYTSGTQGLVFGTSTSEGEYIYRSGNDIRVYAGGSDVLTVDGDNNRVGINDTTPGYTLDVNGSLHSTNFTIADAIYHEGDTNNYIQFGTDTQSFVTNGTSRITIDSSGNTTFGGATYFSEYLYHSGDTNTYLQFNGADNFRVVTGGSERFEVSNSGIIINEGGSDYDFRVESNTVPEMLFVDGGNDRVGIGTSSPNATLHVSGASDVLLVEGSGSTVFEVQGSEGQLFSITDDLTGDLFSVSDISGIPLFNVNASDESYFTGQLEVQGLLTGSTADFSTSITLDTHVMSDSTDRTGLVLLDNNRTSAVWSGHQYTNDSGQLWSIFGNNADFGLYDDTNNEWILLYNINGSVELYYNGAKKVETTSGGIAVAGAITATGDITAYYSSDRRLKENIKPIENATEKIKKIGGYEFDWKPNDNPEMIHEGHDIGVIAQEVEAVLPEIVQDRDNGYKAVEYQKLVALLIESNKELAARVEELEKKLQ